MVPGCGKSQAEEESADDSLQKVLDSGQLIVGVDANFPPMSFTDDTGEIIGFDMDAAEECCARLGIRLIKKPIDWEKKEELLNNGEIDCIWSAMSITPEREQSMELTRPYMKNKMIFIVPKDSDVRNIHSLAGKKVGVQSGSTALDTLEASDIYDELSVITNDSNLELLEMLRLGELDSILIDSVLAYYSVFSGEDSYYVLSDSLGEDKYAIGFRKEDKELCGRIEDLLGELAADGTLGGISQKWFGYDITIAR